MEVSLDDLYFAYDGSREPSVDIAFFFEPVGDRGQDGLLRVFIS